MKFPRVSATVLAVAMILGGFACGQNASESDQRAEAAAAAFCDEHQIAEAHCPFCNPSLIESMGHCAGHNIAEALCYQCNPALIPAFKAVGDWCAGHDRPESQCYICNPELDPARQEAADAKTSDAATYDGDPSDASIEAAHDASTPEGLVLAAPEPRSRRQQPPKVVCSTQNLVVRFTTSDIARDIGLEVVTVKPRAISKTLECNAVVAYDGNRYAHLAAQVPGIVATVQKDLGDRVEPGDTLATITSTHLAVAKASYLQALAAAALAEQDYERARKLLERGVSTEREVLQEQTHLAESRIAVAEAKQELLSLGLSPRQVEEVQRRGDTAGAYVVTASFPAIVVERHAVRGEVVDPSQPLFAVADVSRMWALLDVYETDVREVHAGQEVVLHVEGLPGELFGGQITWVSSELNPQVGQL
jgi:biotin carboxyl carrier protein